MSITYGLSLTQQLGEGEQVTIVPLAQRGVYFLLSYHATGSTVEVDLSDRKSQLMSCLTGKGQIVTKTFLTIDVKRSWFYRHEHDGRYTHAATDEMERQWSWQPKRVLNLGKTQADDSNAIYRRCKQLIF